MHRYRMKTMRIITITRIRRVTPESNSTFPQEFGWNYIISLLLANFTILLHHN